MTIFRKVEAALVPLLEAAGFQKRAGRIFTLDISEGVVGWLGLNQARHPHGIELNPVVGVRSPQLEELLSMLLKERPHKYAPPSASISLGYLMPEGRYRSWIFGDDSVVICAQGLVGAVVSYGIPFMRSVGGLADLEKLLESPQFCSVDDAMYRRPLVKWLLGDREGALRVCDSYVRQLNQRTDLAAEQFKDFAGSLRVLANQVNA